MIERERLQIVTSRAEVFIALRTYAVVDIGWGSSRACQVASSFPRSNVKSTIVRSFGSSQLTVGTVRLSAVSTWKR